MSLFIESIFNSIDGETNGFLGAGQLCTFIRLKGCNLRCSYCDTEYAQEPGEGDEDKMSVEDIVYWPDMLNKVTITGGEPLMQSATSRLICCLVVQGKKVTVETNGSFMPERFSELHPDGNLVYVVDYKLPSSGVEHKMLQGVFTSLKLSDVVKFVIANFDDYYVARSLATCEGWSKARKVFSPAIEDQKDYTGWPAALAQMMITDAKMLGDVQFSLQNHKVLWPYAKEER
jgi:7-carboxy-7-deazaguanine synthase